MASLEQLKSEAIDLYEKTFGNHHPQIAVCAPGRVNLIGEHTDYNDGFVFPMAIDCYTVIVGAKSKDKCGIVTSASVDLPNHVEFVLPTEEKPLIPETPAWADYVKGVVQFFPDKMPEFRAAIVSSVPIGGGLSSSASLEVAMYTFLEALSGKQHDAKSKALVCQTAEHEFPGMPCGIMDQFIAVMGRKDHALLLDCRSMEGKLVHLADSNVVFVIINSNVRHELTGGEYSSRRKQCNEAAQILGKKSLRDVAFEELLKSKDTMDAEIFRRAHHVVTEIDRAVEGAEAFQRGDYDLFGKFMLESHHSLRDDFEVSCDELDQLVELAMSVDGVYGSRMTGGGFGGCTVTLVEKRAVDALIHHIKENYEKATIIISPPADGARVLQL